ncbi:hypothetical protein GJ496_006898 [Pomphorhynchus laevis]|nr:hypothetical protein GJ496_006898 [Pomphorhynchus laevis]
METNRKCRVYIKFIRRLSFPSSFKSGISTMNDLKRICQCIQEPDEFAAYESISIIPSRKSGLVIPHTNFGIHTKRELVEDSDVMKRLKTKIHLFKVGTHQQMKLPPVAVMISNHLTENSMDDKCHGVCLFI